MKNYFILNGGIIPGMLLNINGRTCLYFAVMWGVLGLILIKYVNPIFDKILGFLKSKISVNILKICVLLVMGFLIFDASVTTIALKSFYASLITDFDLDVQQSEYADLNVENSLFSAEHILLIYPNLQIAGTKYNNTMVSSMYEVEKTYYVRIFGNNK